MWLLFAVGVCSTIADRVRFDNYRVYDVSVDNDEQLKVLQYLEQFSDGVSNLCNILEIKLVFHAWLPICSTHSGNLQCRPI